MPAYLIIDDEKTEHVVAGLIMPGPNFFMTEEGANMLHKEHEQWVKNVIVAKTLKEGLDEIKYNSWDTMCLDYDIKEDKGTEISKYLKDNPGKLPKDLYLISFNPYGRHMMYEDLKPFYKYSDQIGNQVVHMFELIKTKEKK